MLQIISISRASLTGSGGEPNAASQAPVFTTDNTLSFWGGATNLVGGDTNARVDIFLKDLGVGTVMRLSTGSGGAQANGNSYNPAFSSDGNTMAFHGDATNLVGGDTNNTNDIFVKNLTTGVVTRVSTDSSGTQGNGSSTDASISADGNLVVFRSYANNLVAGDANGERDIFLKNISTGVTTRMSTDAGGVEGNAGSDKPVISADGSKVAFWSLASNLAAGDTNGAYDVFVKDVATGAVTIASMDAGSTIGNLGSYDPVLSPDGTKVAFRTFSTNLFLGDTNGASDILVKDLTTGIISLVSSKEDGFTFGNGDSFSPVFSPDGTKIAFASRASNLVTGDTNGVMDIFVKDLTTGQVSCVSRTPEGTQAFKDCFQPVWSPDGSKIAFHTASANLANGDANNAFDVYVVSLEGQLTIPGSDGDDSETGGAADDSIDGGLGNDTLDGGAGNDTVNGGEGNDSIIGGDGNDSLLGGDGNDTLDGSVGNDSMLGGDGVDTLTGGAGMDTLDGGLGNDLLLGVDGNDNLDGGDGADTLSGGNGDDLLFGGAGNDVLYGTAGMDTLYGDDGDDSLFGGTENDSLEGGAGNDTVNGDAGDDLLRGGEGNDSLSGGYDNDTIYGDAGDDYLNGWWGNDVLYGGEGNDTLSGGPDMDALYGGNGNDSLMASDGDDTLDGGAGADTLNGGNGNDTLSYAASGGGVSVSLATGSGLGSDAQGDVISGIEHLIGSAYADTLTGGAGQDTLDGGLGNDVLLGGDGNDNLGGGDGADTLSGQNGDDSLLGGAGNDVLYGTAGMDTLYGDDGDDSLFGGTENDSLEGGAGNDTVNGDAGDDLLRGGEGNDSLSGGYDNDTIYGDAGDDYLNGWWGNDVLYGGEGNDTLSGGPDMDALYGGDGNDSLVASDGDDTLDGGAGADTLNGGNGNDHFVFAALSDSTATSQDILVSFVRGQDKLDFSAIAGIDDVGDFAISYSGGSTYVNYDTFSLRMLGDYTQGANQLDNGDFIF